MPTYEYECSKGHHFEVSQRITEDPLERCQVCDAKVRRLISAPAFILKGGGWYSDGYASGGAGNGKSSTDSRESGSKSPSASDSSKSDSSTPSSTTSSD